MNGFPVRAQVLTVCVVLTNVAGNALLSTGVKNAAGIPALLKNPAFLFGVALLALWTVSRTALMSWADLTYVLPVTAIGYVLTTAAGAWFLNEQVSAVRWTATLLIVAGTILAGSTRPRTVPERRE
jgi:uncharacterized membrane protein